MGNSYWNNVWDKFDQCVPAGKDGRINLMAGESIDPMQLESAKLWQCNQTRIYNLGWVHENEMVADVVILNQKRKERDSKDIPSKMKNRISMCRGFVRYMGRIFILRLHNLYLYRVTCLVFYLRYQHGN